MAPPLLKLPPKKGSKPPIVEDEEQDEVEAPEVTKGRLIVPKVASAPKAPLMVITEVPDLTDEEVDAAVTRAIKRTSSFGIKSDAIQQHLKNKDYQKASLTVKEGLVATLVELLPVAEKTFRKSGAVKGTYQFTALIGQIRELLVDLDGERDMKSTVQDILDSAIHPVFMTMAQQIIQFNAAIKRRMRTEFSEQECREKLYPMMDEHIRDLAGYVQGSFVEVSKRVNKSVE